MGEACRKVELSEASLSSLLDEHPVVTKEYTVLTPMIEKSYSYVRERVWLRKTGLFLYAPPRTGKTRCRRSIKLFLEAEFPGLLVVSFSADDGHTSSRTKNGMLIDILRSQGLKSKASAKYKDLFYDLLVYIEMRLTGRRHRHVVLMIDEMQLLSEGDFNTLLTLSNKLEEQGITLTSIGFAQPQILHVRSSFKVANKEQLISRFLVEPVPFDGCGSKEDLMAILQAYDNDTQFPPDSDWTYTRFFFPDAYDRGFRLSESCDDIWQSLLQVIGSDRVASIPMLHLTGAVEYLLAANRTPRGRFFQLDDEIIDRAVSASGLANYFHAVDM